MEKKSQKLRQGRVHWPKIVSGDSIFLLQDDKSQCESPLIVTRSYFGLKAIPFDSREYYWTLTTTDGQLVGHAIVAETEYLRHSDAVSILRDQFRDATTKTNVVKGGSIYAIQLPFDQDENTY